MEYQSNSNKGVGNRSLIHNLMEGQAMGYLATFALMTVMGMAIMGAFSRLPKSTQERIKTRIVNMDK